MKKISKIKDLYNEEVMENTFPSFSFFQKYKSFSNRCDICGEPSNFLVDYYANICQRCKRIHTDTILLQRIGDLIEENKRLNSIPRRVNRPIYRPSPIRKINKPKKYMI